MESNNVQVHQKTDTAQSQEVQQRPEFLSSTNATFQGPVKTLEQFRAALIQNMGKEEGEAMYDKFIKSMMLSTFGSLHKDADRAQRAAKRFRSTYRD